MIPYSMHGVTFNAIEDEVGAFHVFNPDRPEATDRGPVGMVAEMTRFVELSRGNRSLLDVGALFGVFSMVFCALTGGAACAVEASPWAFPVLADHALINNRLDMNLRNAFAGDTTGRPVSCTRDWKHVVGNLDRPENERITLYESRLDDIFPADYFVDIMKIDVEAYEVQVLRGAAQTIQRNRPLLMIEVHMENLPDNGETGASMVALLNSWDYRVEELDGSPAEEMGEQGMTRVIAWP